MIPGTHSRVEADQPQPRARMIVRRSRYLAAFAAIGCSSNEARARKCRLDTKSISRALAGKTVGDLFMAQTVATLRRDEHRDDLAEVGIEPTLDSLFEVAE